MKPKHFKNLFGSTVKDGLLKETMISVVCHKKIFNYLFNSSFFESAINMKDEQLEIEIETEIMEKLEPITRLKTADQVVEKIRSTINHAQEFKKPWTKYENHLAAIKFIEKFVNLLLNPVPGLSDEERKERVRNLKGVLSYLQNELKKSGWLACTQDSEQVTVLHLK